MKKILIVICLSSILFLSSCSVVSDIGAILNDTAYAQDTADEIIDCFNKKDAEALNSLFCSYSKYDHDLHTQIELAFGLFDEDERVISYTVADKSPVETSIRDGEYTKKLFIPHINDVVTNTGDKYSIGFSAYEIYDEVKGKVGVITIALYDAEGNILAVIGANE